MCIKLTKAEVTAMIAEKRLTANIIKCTGSVHMPGPQAGMDDYCYICMPSWAEYLVCPKHETKVNQKTGYCKKCKRYCKLPAGWKK